MKTNLIFNKRRQSSVWLSLALGAILAGSVAAAERESLEWERPPNEKPERAEIGQKLEQLRMELRELERNNRPDEAQEVRQKIGELERQAGRGERRPEMAGLEERMRRMDARIEELRQAGKTEEADQLERERREIQEQLRTGQGREPMDFRRPRPGGEDRERQMQHLRMAIENLHAAGMPELAQRVEREARAQMETGRPLGPREWGPGQTDRLQQLEARVADRMERLEAQVRELHEIMRDLRPPPRPREPDATPP